MSLKRLFILSLLFAGLVEPGRSSNQTLTSLIPECYRNATNPNHVSVEYVRDYLGLDCPEGVEAFTHRFGPTVDKAITAFKDQLVTWGTVAPFGRMFVSCREELAKLRERNEGDWKEKCFFQGTHSDYLSDYLRVLPSEIMDLPLMGRIPPNLEEVCIGRYFFLKDQYTWMFPFHMERWTNLHSLKLNFVGTVLPVQLARAPNLIVLEVRAGIKEIPAKFFDAPKLMELELFDSYLNEIPEALGKLTKLRKLVLTNHSDLRQLPDSLSLLSALEVFTLTRSKLTKVPEALYSLTALQKLDISGNFSMSPLELDGRMGLFTSLKEFKCGHCGLMRLSKLPDSMTFCTALEALNLESNAFNTIPAVIYRLPKLRILDLEDNQLSELPREIGCLSALEKLYLYGNPMRVLPDHLAEATNPNLLIIYGQTGSLQVRARDVLKLNESIRQEEAEEKSSEWATSEEAFKEGF